MPAEHFSWAPGNSGGGGDTLAQSAFSRLLKVLTTTSLFRRLATSE